MKPIVIILFALLLLAAVYRDREDQAQQPHLAAQGVSHVVIDQQGKDEKR